MSPKKILIPTDFTLKSLEILRLAIEESGEQPLDIVLLHGAKLPKGISDLLFFSKPRLISRLKTPEFKEACDMLKNKYSSQIKSIQIEVITYNQLAYFKNFLAASEIQEIFVPKKGILNFENSKGFDTLRLLHKAKIPTTPINLTGADSNEYPGTLVSAIYFSQVNTTILSSWFRRYAPYPYYYVL